MPSNFFEELDILWQGAVIFLDVDGTLRPDGNEELESKVAEKLEKLKSQNEVHLVTNKDSRIKKPSRKAAGDVDIAGRKTIVIGDKFLTDYLFAKNIGAEFVMVRRKVSGKESLLVKLTYFIDNLVYRLAKILWITKNI